MCYICDLSVRWNVYSKPQRKYSLSGKIIINGHRDYLGLSFYIHHKYFLWQPNLLLMPSFISSNTLPLSPPLSVSPLSCSLPTTFCSVFNPVMSNTLDQSINAFCKELFSFLKVAPTQNILVLKLNQRNAVTMNRHKTSFVSVIFKTSWFFLVAHLKLAYLTCQMDVLPMFEVGCLTQASV